MADLTDFVADQNTSGKGVHNTLGGGGKGSRWRTVGARHIIP